MKPTAAMRLQEALQNTDLTDYGSIPFWSWNNELDETECTHPCLVEYENLSEADKEYDRVTAMEAIKLLLKMGYKITKDKQEEI